jgi:hypothetical protein
MKKLDHPRALTSIRTDSLPRPPSPSGNAIFQGGDKDPLNAPSKPIGRLQRQNACTNRREFGAIHTEPGNPRLRRTTWWARELLNNLPNLRPYIYKPVYKRQLKLKAFSGAFTNRRTEPSERHDYQAMILDWESIR